MKIKILTEAETDIGYGHLSRSSSLYDEAVARGLDVELIVHGVLGAINFLGNKEIRNINWMDVDFIQSEIKEGDYLIIDSYLAGLEVYEALARQTKNLLFIDDTNRLPYPPGIIVNPAIGIGQLDYKISKRQEFYYGLDYIILRQPFQNSVSRESIGELRNILIVMGGTDPNDLAGKIIEKLREQYPDLLFHIIVNQGKLASYRKYYQEMENLNFYSNLSASQMRDLMLSVDLAISAGGQTIYELLACQTPIIPVATADNQESHLSELVDRKMVDDVINVKDDDWLENLTVALAGVINKVKLSRENDDNIVRKDKSIIDGCGSKRIIDLLLASL